VESKRLHIIFYGIILMLCHAECVLCHTEYFEGCVLAARL